MSISYKWNVTQEWKYAYSTAEIWRNAGVGKVRPAGQMRPASSVNPARGSLSVVTLWPARVVTCGLDMAFHTHNQWPWISEQGTAIWYATPATAISSQQPPHQLDLRVKDVVVCASVDQFWTCSHDRIHRNSSVVAVVLSFLRLRFSCRARTLLASKSWTPFLQWSPWDSLCCMQLNFCINSRAWLIRLHQVASDAQLHVM